MNATDIQLIQLLVRNAIIDCANAMALLSQANTALPEYKAAAAKLYSANMCIAEAMCRLDPTFKDVFKE